MYNDRSYCGELSAGDVGKGVTLAGWVEVNRNLGGIIFIKLRDVSGTVQVVFDSSVSPGTSAAADRARSEFVVLTKGTVRKRDDKNINPELPTGQIEVLAESIEILSASRTPPIPIDTREQIGEEARLTYRYLDLRREEMRNAIIMRHRAMQSIRAFLSDHRFLEIETPVLNKSTPEGARDFLVPSRISPGKFYALPQSPQLFKQILMISGFDRYFQIVKCFRDEDLRGDRQPEFTQVDMELSFTDADAIMGIIERLLAVVVREVTGREVSLPFPRLTYRDAMDAYGTDAPDTRFGLEIRDCSDIFGASEFRVFSDAVGKGGMVKGIMVPDAGAVSRKMLDRYAEEASVFGAKGLPMFRYNGSAAEGGIAKFIGPGVLERLEKRLGLESGCMVIFSADADEVVSPTLASLRVSMARDLGLIDEGKLNFLWVTDFPLFEFGAEDRRLYSRHHPFTAPTAESIPLLESLDEKNAVRIIARAYDVVLNGVEIGGGSIRINDPDLQSRIFTLLGMTREDAEEKFSFLIEALAYGAPPHGGIALGLDRIMMILLGKKSIRDVIAFPKTTKGQCLMSNAPSPVSDGQLRELGLKVVDK